MAFAATEAPDPPLLESLVSSLRQRLLVREASGVCGFRGKIKAMDLLKKIISLESASPFRHAAREALPTAVEALTRYECGDGEPEHAAELVQATAKRLLQMVVHGLHHMPNTGEIKVAARSKKESMVQLREGQRLRW